MLKGIIGLFVFSLSVNASFDVLNQSDKDYLTLESVTVQEVTDSIPFEGYSYELTSPSQTSGSNEGDVFDKVDKMIAIGKQVYEIVKKGKPIVNLKEMQNISIIPNVKGLSAQNMTGWEAPKYKSYKIIYKNLFGMEVVSFKYTIFFQYAGQYEGKGAYITGLNIMASEVDVAWGFELNSYTKAEEITNTGSADEPVAGAIVSVWHQVKTLLKDSRQRGVFFTSGHGVLTKMN